MVDRSQLILDLCEPRKASKRKLKSKSISKLRLLIRPLWPWWLSPLRTTLLITTWALQGKTRMTEMIVTSTQVGHQGSPTASKRLWSSWSLWLRGRKTLGNHTGQLPGEIRKTHIDATLETQEMPNPQTLIWPSMVRWLRSLQTLRWVIRSSKIL